MLQIYNLEKNYGSTVALNLKQQTLSIGQGEIVGLFGENGAGKTTLMKCILGLTGTNSGLITLDDKPITKDNIGRFAFATCEHSFFPSITAKGHMQFYRDFFSTFNGKRFNGLMNFFGLPDNKPIRELSTGQQNQFEIVLALSQGADYILMDEPFAGNDIFNREDFYKVILGILEPHETIILSTHLIEEVSTSIDRAVLIKKGRIIGDIKTAELEEQGKSVVSFVKEKYGYIEDRVSTAVEEITGEN